MPRKVLRGDELAAFLTRHSRLVRALRRARIKIKVAVLKRRRRTLHERAVHVASRYVGVKEYPAGSNVTLFGKWYGFNGVPWCAIFASFVLSHAGRPFKYASVPLLVKDAIAKNGGLSVIPTAKVNAALRAGYPVLACYDWEHDGTPDHVGLVTRYDSQTKSVHAIEGNTSATDWSNGGEVCREVRPVSTVQAFVKVS